MSELELLKNYNKIRTNFNFIILGCYRNYDDIYKKVTDQIDNFINDLIYCDEKAFNAYCCQLYDDAKVTSGNIYRYVITAFEDISWMISFE